MAAPTILNEFDTKRNADNLRCLAALAKLLARNPQMRVGQLIHTAKLREATSADLFNLSSSLLAYELESMLGEE